MKIKIDGNECNFLVYCALWGTPEKVNKLLPNYRPEVQEFAKKILNKDSDVIDFINQTKSAFPNKNVFGFKGSK